MVADMRQSRVPPSRAVVSIRYEGIRRNIRGLFTGQSVVGNSTRRIIVNPPRSSSGPKTSSSTRGSMPHFHRARTAPSMLPSSSGGRQGHRPSAHLPITSRTITRNSLQGTQRSMSLQQEMAHSSSQLYRGVYRDEQHPADLIRSGRSRRTTRTRRHRKKRACTMDMTDGRVRARFIACCISAMLLLTVLTIYLVLALSNRDESQEFHVLLILVILVTTIFFCHSLISLCVILMRAPRDPGQPRMSLIGPGGFANPPQPIRVALARDEEAAGFESEALKIPPPAYGLWRESVRADPNQLFWQRTESPSDNEDTGSVEIANSELFGAPRPPSYVSDDGVGYVLQPEPRSTNAEINFSLPTHPSERGRTFNPSNN